MCKSSHVSLHAIYKVGHSYVSLCMSFLRTLYVIRACIVQQYTSFLRTCYVDNVFIVIYGTGIPPRLYYRPYTIYSTFYRTLYRVFTIDYVIMHDVLLKCNKY